MASAGDSDVKRVVVIQLMGLNMRTYFSHVFMLSKYVSFLTVHLLDVAQAPACSSVAASCWSTSTVWWRGALFSMSEGAWLDAGGRVLCLLVQPVYFLVLFGHLADSLHPKETEK